MKKFWRIFYALAAVFGVIYGFLYWFEVLPADNIGLAFYCWGWACMCAGEAIRRKE